MSEKIPHFVAGFARSSRTEKKRSKNCSLTLCYKQAYYQNTTDENSSITTNGTTDRLLKKIQPNKKSDGYKDDGLYLSNDSPLTKVVVKPYPLEQHISFCRSAIDRNSNAVGKQLEIAIREVNLASNALGKLPPKVQSVSLLYKDRIVCRTNAPFNRKLHKLFLRSNSKKSNSNCDLSLQVQLQDGSVANLPLPIPERKVEQKRIEVEFSIEDNNGCIHSGVLVCTVSSLTDGIGGGGDNVVNNNNKTEFAAVGYSQTPSSNDPNDPRNSFATVKPSSRNEVQKKQTRYFLLQHPALVFPASVALTEFERKKISSRKSLPKLPDIVVAEQMFSLLDISFSSWFQERRPLRPSSGQSVAVAPKHHSSGRKQILTVTVLRGVEVPVREESATVQPIVEIEWGDSVRSTSVSEGPAPVWQQTLQFELPTLKMSEHYVKIRLFDQHPVWGLQWLGEARIPIECHRNYQQLERWIGLSSLYSPTLSFGYVQASPGYSYTRIYVLMKMEQLGNFNPIENSSIGTLCKAIQRCLAVPYKISEIESAEDATRLVMLLAPLPVHYGPLTPRQALNLNKVDHYGRSALLATLLQGLGLQAYVVLGSSQTRKWASFTLTANENGVATLWDAENGDHYELEDNRCSLISVSRLIDNQNIWENTLKSWAPVNLKYDPKTNKDWQILISTASVSGNRGQVQTVDLNIARGNDDKLDDSDGRGATQEMEENLKESLSQWRANLELPTIFNRHADSVLREIIARAEDRTDSSQLDKRELRQLYRAYYTHGFIVNVRYIDLEDLIGFLLSTKVHAMTGPIEFSLVCHVKKLVGKIRSVWLAVVVLRNKS